jgi:hypothetical protein
MTTKQELELRDHYELTAKPMRAWRSHTMPRHTEPCPAAPKRAEPDHALPGLALS